MPIPSDEEELTKLFERLGARDPESWASSQISEGIEQLHRFLFLRQAWAMILPERDADWIPAEIERANGSPRAPYSGIGIALSRCIEKGVDPQDLTDIVRGMQTQLLFSLCYLLEDPGFEEGELEDIGWCLVATDKNLQPTDFQIGGLHESVLKTDPTGREMRPRDV